MGNRLSHDELENIAESLNRSDSRSIILWMITVPLVYGIYYGLLS